MKLAGTAVIGAVTGELTGMKEASAETAELLEAEGKNRPQKARQAYLSGGTCAQAVISAYAKDMGLDERMAKRMMETFGGGIAGRQEACGAFVAAILILSYVGSNGKFEYGESRNRNFDRTRELASLFEEKYGGLKCIEVLKGNKPKAGYCHDTVLQTAKMLEKVLANHKEELMKFE